MAPCGVKCGQRIQETIAGFLPGPVCRAVEVAMRVSGVGPGFELDREQSETFDPGRRVEERAGGAGRGRGGDHRGP